MFCIVYNISCSINMKTKKKIKINNKYPMSSTLLLSWQSISCTGAEKLFSQTCL